MATRAADRPGALADFRHDVNCRNCGAPAPAVYCPSCGQETKLALPTARQFVKDAAGRYVSLDGRLWRTLGALMFRPGFLTREYLEGRRRRYVRPARLFLVLSLAMFALFRLLVELPHLSSNELVKFDIRDDGSGPSLPTPAGAKPERSAPAPPPIGEKPPATGSAPQLPTLTVDDNANVLVDGPPGFVTDALKRRVERFNALTPDAKAEQMVLGAVRYGPYAMVLLLPVFALLLKVLYLGRGRRYPRRPQRYSEHLVFAAHDLSFLFLVVMAMAVVPWQWVTGALMIWVLAYGLWAMKAVYGGRWSGVIARALVIGVAYIALFAVIVAGLIVTAVLVR